MRICAIRGANLASLEGDFALELADGPLSEAGVFAICGPTGAGKTTLLDAMCLALFDTAPRLDASRRVRVGTAADDERLTTRDPRSVLRKGAGRGHAEVEFEGADGRRYLARWEVRRARERADGKMQASAMSLVDLASEERWGGRKTDVKAEIERRLGLSFDQFRRSVLLAQGDFAAFLDADPRERADLLERMTGTAIYGVISQEAHARANEETRRLELIGERLRAVPELSEAEREELSGRLDALAIQVRADELHVANATAALRWHHELDGLRREEQRAKAERLSTLRQLALAETKRHELAAYEAALPLRPHLEAVDAAEALVARRDRERGEYAARAQKAKQAVERATAAAVEARAALGTANEARDRSRENVERARTLDRAITEREGQRASLFEAEGEAERARASIAERHASIGRELEAAQADADRAVEWLADNPAAEALERDWTRAEEHLDRVVELSEALAPLRCEEEAAASAAAEAERLEAEREGRWRGLALSLAEARAEHTTLRAAVDAAPSSALAEESRQWAARRTALETLIGVAERAQQAQGARHRHLERAARARAAAEAARSRLASGRAARERSLARVEEALAHRDRIRATLDLSERRGDLVAGEPCPLCGSEEHPYAHEAPVINALLESADERARELREELSAIDAAIAEAGKEAQAEDEHAARDEAEARDWAEALEAARGRYRGAARELDGPWPDELPQSPAPQAQVVEADAADWGPLFALVSPSDEDGTGALLSEGAQAALHEARDVAIEELRRVGEEERIRRAREERADASRARFESAREAELTGREALDEARRAVSAARDGRARLGQERARLEAERNRSVDRLAASLEGFDGWRERLAAEPGTLAVELRDAVSARRTWLAIAERARAKVAERRPALDVQAVELRQATEAAGRAKVARERLDAELNEERARRRELLGGVSADEAEARAAAAHEAARVAAERAEETLRLAHRDDAEAAARAERAEVMRIEADVARKEVDDTLASALEEAGLDRDSARARLARDPAEVEGFREELRRLDAQRAEQTAVLAERERKRELHETTDPPALGAEEAAGALSTFQQRLSETRELLVAVRSRLESDGQHRAQAAELRVSMAEQMDRLEIWTVLNDLIGSANGNKLRVFAQSLTLELLIDHANHHLRDLSPRYGLSRIPGEDLALQVVDHEMGDEVRAVTSLSGGESFLVALGLALGLASLSSQQARVDSLFIDEGFGALDPSSLEMVLSTLDVLQASGRQVGLISHVPAVAERFDTRVQVVASGPARSRVELVDRAASMF